MTVLRQASLTHKGDQDMTGRKKGSRVLGRMVCYRFYLKAIGSKDRWDQTVIGAALGGIIAIGSRPVRDRYRGNGFSAICEAGDEHGCGGRTTSILEHGI